jgi:hypothetical protein
MDSSHLSVKRPPRSSNSPSRSDTPLRAVSVLSGNSELSYQQVTS